MPELANLLIYLTFSIPLLVGILVIIFNRRVVKWIFWFAFGLVMANLVGLGLMGEQEIVSSLSFLGEPITFSIATTPILIFLVTLLVLLILLYRNSRSDNDPLTSFQTLLISFSISFGFVAFISGQFMIRYIALDIVGLLAGLTVLDSFDDKVTWKHFSTIFQILRLGDLSLLASILLIHSQVDILDISQMINASTEMPIYDRTWVYLGFFFAILIKIAIWPFGLWLRQVRKTTSGPAYWLSGFLMPSLGYYLLYRITPLLGSHAAFRNFTLFFTIILIALILLTDFMQLVAFDRAIQMGGMMSSFLLIALSAEAKQYLVFYILALILYRWALLIRDHTENRHVSDAITFLPLFLNGFYLWFNLDRFSIMLMVAWGALTVLVILSDVWANRREKTGEGAWALTKGSQSIEVYFSKALTNFSSWLNDKLEVEIFGTEVYHFSNSFVRFANWVHEGIEERLEDFWSWIGQGLIKISEGTLFNVEVGVVEKTGELMDEALSSLESYDESVLKKTLRWDLAWIPLLLAVILIMLFII